MTYSSFHNTLPHLPYFLIFVPYSAFFSRKFFQFFFAMNPVNLSSLSLHYPNNGLFPVQPLPYDITALAPAISAETLSFHHNKHYAGYVNKLNELLSSDDNQQYAGLSLEEIFLQTAEGTLHNQAGQILNHELYFNQFMPTNYVEEPSSALADAIVAQYGSLDAFKSEFENKGVTLFGSGWVWLSCDADGMLHITQETNASNPISKGLSPLLTFDVWEHAYYLDYQNRRASHLDSLWSILNWKLINERYIR